MSLNNWIATWVSIFLAGFIIGLFLGKGCAPEVRVGTETTMVTVTVHDTIVSQIPQSNIVSNTKIIYIPKIIYIDSTHYDTTQVSDTSICYSFDEKEQDGSYIKAEICSDSLPVSKPLDLRAAITYLPHPDTSRQIFRIDTVMRTTNTPFFKDWRTYTIVALAATILIPKVAK